MESNEDEDDDDDEGDELLERLFALSGREVRTPTEADRTLIVASLLHPRSDVRERAIFIGGLRWMDEELLNDFRRNLECSAEPDDDNRRLMIESLVSAAIERGIGRETIRDFLLSLLRTSSHDSNQARVAYVGIGRLDGRITKQQFATLDYSTVTVVPLF